MEVIIAIGGGLLGYLLHWIFWERQISWTKAIAQQIREQALRESTGKGYRLLQKTEGLIAGRRAHFSTQLRETYKDFYTLEFKLVQKELDAEKRTGELSQRQQKVPRKTQEIETLRQEIAQLTGQWLQQQKQIQEQLLIQSGYSLEAVKTQLRQQIDEEVQQESASYQKRKIAESRQEIQRYGVRILAETIQRCNFSHWVEPQLTSWEIPEGPLEEILSQEAYLRIFAETLATKLLFQSRTLTLISPDGLNREIARRTLESLEKKSAVTIEEIAATISEIRQIVEKENSALGQRIVQQFQWPDVHPQLPALLGRLQYRTSFGQNILSHSIEVARLAFLLAAELGLDPHFAGRAGLLHDIGKAIDHEKEGGHAEIGRELLRQMGESPTIIEAAIGHYDSIRESTPYATLIMIADAISAARPGARRETLENYLQRLEKLENIARGEEGIESVFAISAGRELRVIVDSQKISDRQVAGLASRIAKTIEEELDYPGMIKVTVLRELKVVKYAAATANGN